MYALTEAQYQVQAKPLLRQIFVNDDPFDHPFSPNITARKIIYPCQCYVERPLINAVIAAASTLGDTGCYFSQLWPSPSKTNHCYITLSEFLETYAGPPGSDKRIGVKLDMDILSENVIYSAQGKWGIMLSHEHHGMLGGSPEFIEIISGFIPDLDKQVYGFLGRLQGFKADRPDIVTLGWLPGLLTHVYGQEAAEKMLEETGLP